VLPIAGPKVLWSPGKKRISNFKSRNSSRRSVFLESFSFYPAVLRTHRCATYAPRMPASLQGGKADFGNPHAHQDRRALGGEKQMMDVSFSWQTHDGAYLAAVTRQTERSKGPEEFRQCRLLRQARTAEHVNYSTSWKKLPSRRPALPSIALNGSLENYLNFGSEDLNYVDR
jgi:hypothetical protein